MSLAVITKSSTLEVGRPPESASDIPNEEILLKFSKCF